MPNVCIMQLGNHSQPGRDFDVVDSANNSVGGASRNSNNDTGGGTSWSAGNSSCHVWRVPEVITTESITPFASPVLSSCDVSNSSSTLPACANSFINARASSPNNFKLTTMNHSISLIEACEEESNRDSSNIGDTENTRQNNDANRTITEPLSTDGSCGNTPSISPKCNNNVNNINNISNNRLKAKISLDENRLRTNSGSSSSSSSNNCDFANENFTRSGAITRTLGLEHRFESSSCSPFSGGGRHPKSALARSSSYQALHSALARLYRLDDFITERLGQGFFSEVFKARHRVTGEVMVLKMNKLVSNRHNMLREVELMNRLHHPNILTYYGVCINEGQVHALTEYINGGSLDAMLQDSSIDVGWSERVSLAADTARGMAYLHKQGVVHRDLTSKNVLIKESSGSRRKREAVVADFGLAAPIPKDKSVRMRQVGSPYWMAPEVIRGVWYDQTADVFSYGIILCEMIARCEADPDVLPRTNNFGVHYLAFSRMCEHDTPPYFLQMAFQCCQIDPDTRPIFDVLTKNFESLHNRMVGHRTASAHRKQKVCHRRSLSDDCLMLGRQVSTSSDDGANYSATATAPSAGGGNNGGSGGMSSNGCHPPAPVGRTPQEVVERMGEADPYFTASTATVNPFTRVKLPAPSRLTVQDGARFCHSLPDSLFGYKFESNDSSSDRNRQQNLYQYSNNGSSSSGKNGRYHHGSHCSLATQDGGASGRHVSSSSGRNGGGDGVYYNYGGVGHMSGAPHLAGAIKRRGSGESGFFSVGGDAERTGTPEQWLSYSELSCASLALEGGWEVLEDEQRSWVTDSSEDAAPETDRDAHETDIKAIVEFFERGYGSLRPGPLIGPRSARLSSPRSPASPPHPHHLWASSGSSTASSRAPPSTKSGLRPLSARVKDRPKLYITEGTVRARRDIFEAK